MPSFPKLLYENSFLCLLLLFLALDTDKDKYNKQMVNAIACTIELWYTREVAKHERSVRVARGDSRVRL